MKAMKKKIPTEGSSSSSINTAFAGLRIEGLPQGVVLPASSDKPSHTEKLGKVTLAIEKSGRSGKTVTVIKESGIEKLTAERREELLASLKRKFACGGTIEGDTLELQGDERSRIKIFLQSLGFST